MDPLQIEDISSVSDLPPVPPRRRPPARWIAAGALGVAVLLAFGLVLHAGGGGHPVTAPAPKPTPRLPAGSLADGLGEVTSLVDVGGYLWATGSYPGNQSSLVRVQLSSGKAAETVLMSTHGPPLGVSHLTVFSGRVFGVTTAHGIASLAADGTAVSTLTQDQLGSGAEDLAAAPGTGLWLLSCCGVAPTAQQLAQERDPVSLHAVGDARDISPLTGSLFAAGPAGVWLIDGEHGRLRRIDKPNLFVSEPQLESAPARVSLDLLAVGTGGPVLATHRQLVAVDATSLAPRRLALPAGALPPTALTVTGTTAYLAYPDHVITYDLLTLTPGASIPVSGVTAMTAGPDGVWAATDGQLIQLAR